MKTRPTWISSHGRAMPLLAAAAMVPFLLAQEKTGGRENLLKSYQQNAASFKNDPSIERDGRRPWVDREQAKDPKEHIWEI